MVDKDNTLDNSHLPGTSAAGNPPALFIYAGRWEEKNACMELTSKFDGSGSDTKWFYFSSCHYSQPMWQISLGIVSVLKNPVMLNSVPVM